MIPARDVALITGLTMRLTRLVVSDDLGQWWLKDPLAKLVDKHTNYDMPNWPAEKPGEVDGVKPPEWARYAEGLDCPWCFGYWAGVVALGSYHLSGLHPKARSLWRFGAATFSLSYVVGQTSSRLD